MPTCAASGDSIWVAYGVTADANTVNRADRLSAIRVARSSDGGRTFAARSRVADATYMMHPRLVLDGAGVLHLLHYAGAADGDAHGSFRHARSLDGGATWTASETAFAGVAFVTARTGLDWLGDYVGAAARGGSVYTAYVQNRFDAAAVAHVAFARVDAP
jgi:hypothetical protein